MPRVEKGRVSISSLELDTLLRLYRASDKEQLVFSEQALRRMIGSPKIMAEQLRHLAEIALLPHVTIQIIPFDTLSYDTLGYDFTIFRFDSDASTDMVYIEIYEDALYLDKPDVVR